MSRRRRSDPDTDKPVQRGPAPSWRGNRVFYVAVEGESTEPDYLAHLNKEFGPEHQFFIQPLFKRNGMTPSQVVDKALEYRDELGDDDTNRDNIHEKLRQQAGFERFDVHNDKSIRGRRADALRGKQGAATKRAKRLVDECPTGACSARDDHAAYCDPLRRDPSTDVWRLLAELGIVDS